MTSERRGAVVGCGYWGKNLVRSFRALDGLALVCEATEAGRAVEAESAPEVPVTARAGNGDPAGGPDRGDRDRPPLCQFIGGPQVAAFEEEAFFASPESIGNIGAVPIFADIVPATFNLDLNRVRAAIKPRTRVIMPGGPIRAPGDMDGLMSIASEHDLPVIENWCPISRGAVR